MAWILGIVGIVIGMIVIAFGGGGAAIYLGVLTAVFHLAPAAAAATSIVTALPSILIGVIGYWRQGKIDVKLGNRMLLTALPAVLIGSLAAPYIPQTLYSWIIGVILIALGLQISLAKSKKNAKDEKAPSSTPTPSSTTRTVFAISNRTKASLFGVLSGLMMGVAGLSGGGPVLAGLLLMGLELFNATATSSYVLAGMSILGAGLHLATGGVDWSAGLPLMIGAMIGAVLAPLLVKALGSRMQGSQAQGVKRVLGILFVAMGIKTIL
jgi:uncharacterized membrane protein YfcA